jgi:hypothetical protein
LFDFKHQFQVCQCVQHVFASKVTLGLVKQHLKVLINVVDVRIGLGGILEGADKK